MHELVWNTSPIQYLHKVGCLERCLKQGQKNLLPTDVFSEIEVGVAKGISLPTPSSLKAHFDVTSVADTSWFPLVDRLGQGELSVIGLCLERKERVAVLDDLPARQYAQRVGIRITGTLGLLLDMKKRGDIDRLEPLLKTLESVGFRLSESLRQEVLRLAGEEGA